MWTNINYFMLKFTYLLQKSEQVQNNKKIKVKHYDCSRAKFLLGKFKIKSSGASILNNNKFCRCLTLNK